MFDHALADRPYAISILDFNRELDQYYCVEVPVRVGLIYQFRIWQVNRNSMSILVRERSRFLSYIKINRRFNMKYYSTDDLYPYQELMTVIKSITPQEGRFLRGHSLVEIEIVEEAEEAKINSLAMSKR
jgi:hypothetical protein